MAWYMAIMDGEAENEYEQYRNDEDAICGFLAWAGRQDEDCHVLEIWRCDNDECLTPIERAWPR